MKRMRNTVKIMKAYGTHSYSKSQKLMSVMKLVKSQQ